MSRDFYCHFYFVRVWRHENKNTRVKLSHYPKSCISGHLSCSKIIDNQQIASHFIILMHLLWIVSLAILFQKQTLYLNELLLWRFFFKTRYSLTFFSKSIKEQEKSQKNTNETEKETSRKLNSSLSFLGYSLQSLICVGLFLILKKNVFA